MRKNSYLMTDPPHPRYVPPHPASLLPANPPHADRHIPHTSRLHVKKTPEDRYRKWLAKYDPQVVAERIKQSLESSG
jgi:hypothetical protein